MDRALALALVAASVVGAILLIVADFTTLFQVKTITVVVKSTKGGSHHTYALVVIGVLALVFAYGAARGSRPAMGGLIALGGLALMIALLVDLPDINATGTLRDYSDAKASPRTGFYLETLGAVLLLVAGGGGLLLSRPERGGGARGARKRDEAARAEAAARRAEARSRRHQG